MSAPVDIDRLAIYNAETGRGISHTSAYDAEMASEQRKFNEWKEARRGPQ
jgi:hypothetical protein